MIESIVANITFSTEINAGSLIAAGSVILTLFTLHNKNTRRIARFENRLNLMWNVFKKRFDVSDDEEIDHEE